MMTPTPNPILGTLLNPMLEEVLILLFQKDGGGVLLAGMIVAVVGIAIFG